MDLFEPAIGNTMNTCSFNVTGHPAMSMPVGWGEVKGGGARLPVGMQVVGRRWGEGDIFKAVSGFLAVLGLCCRMLTFCDLAGESMGSWWELEGFVRCTEHLYTDKNTSRVSHTNNENQASTHR